MAAPDADVRRLAADVRLRISGGGGGDYGSAAADLDVGGGRRLAALERLARAPERPLDALLPKVLDATADPDAAIRVAALGALSAHLDAEAQSARHRILVSLLGAADPRLVRAAIDALAAHVTAPAGEQDPFDPREDPEIMAMVRAGLEGPAESRGAAARLWLDLHADGEAEAAVQAFAITLPHPDPAVRGVALHLLATQPAARRRVQVRDGLMRPIVERLRDPEPGLRLEAARAVLGQSYPTAATIVAQLALDPDPSVRQGVLAVLGEAGHRDVLDQATATAHAVETLFAGLVPGESEARRHWGAALGEVARLSSPWVLDLLVALLRDIPPESPDPALQQAIEAIDALMVKRTGGDEDLLMSCRRLLEAPFPRPEHAARLAGRAAAENPRAIDFLWLLYTGTSGAGATAAQSALRALASLEKSSAVEAEIANLRSLTDEPSHKAFLARLLGHPG